MKVTAIVCLSLLVAGCDGPVNKQLPTTPLPAIDRSDATLESLDASYHGTSLVVQVISSGCTRAEHFSVSSVVDENVCLVSLKRDSPDYCKRAAFVQTLKMDWPMTTDCCGLPVEFANPFAFS